MKLRIIQNILNTIEKLIGIRDLNGTKNYESLINTIWVFVAGIPIGLILFTNQFNITIWLAIVSGTLIIKNIINYK